VADPLLKVGHLSSWNTRCGIAEYSRYLVGALRRRGDVEVSVFGSRNYGERAVREYDDGEQAIFDIQIWHPEGRSEFDPEPILDAGLDVLHVQYSNAFYERRAFVDLLERFDGVVALTFHDNSGAQKTFPWQLADVRFTHRENVGVGERIVIAMGIDVQRPVVKTFGMGKSRADLIGEVCARNDWDFQASFGGERWLESDELHAWLRDCDAIVLWYPDDRTAGASAAAANALATRRPVFVNDTKWVSDNPQRTHSLVKVQTVEELEREMRAVLVDPFIESRSWDRVADVTVAAYRDALVARTPGERRHAPARARAFAAMDLRPVNRLLRRY
jgi:hypothetical protein